MLHAVTGNLKDPTYRKEEIVDDGKPWADDKLLGKYMAQTVLDYLREHPERRRHEPAACPLRQGCHATPLYQGGK